MQNFLPDPLLPLGMSGQFYNGVSQKTSDRFIASHVVEVEISKELVVRHTEL